MSEIINKSLRKIDSLNDGADPSIARSIVVKALISYAESLLVHCVVQPYGAGDVELTDLKATVTGLGNGSNVMRALSALTDAAGIQIVVAPSSERNSIFYERFNFLRSTPKLMVRYPDLLVNKDQEFSVRTRGLMFTATGNPFVREGQDIGSTQILVKLRAIESPRLLALDTDGIYSLEAPNSMLRDGYRAAFETREVVEQHQPPNDMVLYRTDELGRRGEAAGVVYGFFFPDRQQTFAFYGHTYGSQSIRFDTTPTEWSALGKILDSNSPEFLDNENTSNSPSP